MSINAINSSANIANIQKTNLTSVKNVANTAPYPNDSFTTTSEPKEKSNKMLWALGGLAILGAAALIMRGRFSGVKKLAEHIDFQPAKTIDEAKAFAKQHLGIRKFKVDDLEMANYVNEGLTQVSNRAKGHIVLPKTITVGNGGGRAVMAVGTKSKELYLNPQVVKWDTLSGMCMNRIKKLPPDKQKVALEQLQKLEILFKKGSYAAKTEILAQVHNFALPIGLRRSKFHALYHEIGHLNHASQNPSLFKYYSKGGTGLDIATKPNKINLDHLVLCEEKLGKGWAANFGIYSATSPNEFVAEMYGYLMQGKKLPKEVMEIYSKYGGPKI